jgi:hypothetical protein
MKIHLNLGPFFIYRLMVTPSWLLNILFFAIFIVLSYFICDSSYEDFISHMGDKDNTNLNIGNNATVNVSADNGKVSVSVDHMNRVAAAISATGGATAGIQVAKYVAGPPAVKLVAGVAIAGAVQLTTTFMSKVLDSKNDKGAKLVTNLDESSNGLNNYPLNLLFEINGLLICGLIFMYIILNIYISKYIITKDLNKYIPNWVQNSKIGKIFVFWLNKYLNLWSKSSNYLLGFCYFMLLFCMIICKIGLYLILSNI